MNTSVLFGLAIATTVDAAALRIVREYERGVIVRLGRLKGPKGPGLFFIIPLVDRMVKVNLQTVTIDIKPQHVIAKHNVTVRVHAGTYLRISATSGTDIVLIQTLSSDTLNRILEYVDNTTRLDHPLKVGITGRAAL